VRSVTNDVNSKKNKTKMPRTSARSRFCSRIPGIFQPHLRILVVVHERRHDDVGQQRWGVTEGEKLAKCGSEYVISAAHGLTRAQSLLLPHANSRNSRALRRVRGAHCRPEGLLRFVRILPSKETIELQTNLNELP